MLALSVILTALPAYRLTALQCPDGSRPPCRAAREATAPVPTSVAVLYFENLSRDTADAYLADGLTEAIIERLGEIAELTVTSRFAVRPYRAPTQSPLALGRALRVAHLVSGTVRGDGKRLRVRVELLRATDGTRRWGARWDRPAADLLALEDDIAREVTRAIVGALAPRQLAVLLGRTTRQPQAEAHYRRGNFYLAKRGAAALVRARAEYEAALRLDPAFNRARARLAYVAGIALDNVVPAGWRQDSLLTQGLVESERAVREDSGNADAWLALGYLRSYRHAWTLAGVRDAMERAIALEPANPEANHQFAWILALLGEDSLAEARAYRALALDPTRAVTWNDLATLYLTLRRYAEARRAADSANALDPPFAGVQLFEALWELGDTAGARSLAETGSRWAAETGSRWAMRMVAARAGDVTARDSLRLLVEEGLMQPDSFSGSGASHHRLAWAAIVSGAPDLAIEILRRTKRGARIGYYLRRAVFDPLRADPRFQQIVAESRPR